MTMDEALDAFTQAEAFPRDAIQWALDTWQTTGPQCRALLHGYVEGTDLSERTEQALFVVLHLLGEQADTASFADLCRLAMDPERVDSVLGDDGVAHSLPAILISTFDGDARALHQVIESATDEFLRGDTLLVLAYLARSRRCSEAALYDYLAALPDRLQPVEQSFVWFGWVRAVAALGFAGLSGRAEQIFQRGLVDPAIIESGGFWTQLRESQEDPHGTSGQAWEDIGPMGRAIDWLMPEPVDGPDAEPAGPPVRNPLRHVGRNDPCPCGSGKKYKKCCLAA